MERIINQKTRGGIALLSTIIFIVFIVTVLPREALKSAALGLDISPDTLFYYTASQLYEIAQSYGLVGREFYVRQRLTFDVIWPLIYTSFLFFTSLYFIYQLNIVKWSKFLLSFSLLAFTFDILENISVSVVMIRYPKETFLLDHLAGFMTSLKWISLSISFLILFILFYDFIRLLFSKEKK